MKNNIIVNLYYTGKNENVLKFADEMESRGIAEKIRSSKGNIRYDYYISKTDPETVLLIDEWENQESLDSHHQSPMMDEILELREKY